MPESGGGILAHSERNACFRWSILVHFLEPTLSFNISQTEKSNGFANHSELRPHHHHRYRLLAFRWPSQVVSLRKTSLANKLDDLICSRTTQSGSRQKMQQLTTFGPTKQLLGSFYSNFFLLRCKTMCFLELQRLFKAHLSLFVSSFMEVFHRKKTFAIVLNVLKKWNIHIWMPMKIPIETWALALIEVIKEATGHLSKITMHCINLQRKCQCLVDIIIKHCRFGAHGYEMRTPSIHRNYE